MLVGTGAAQPARARRASRSIDTAAAEALPGVKAVITARRLPGSAVRVHAGAARCWSTTATWRATSWRARRRSTRATPSPPSPPPAPRSPRQALKLIEVEYEVLPHVIDVVEAMQPGAPLLHDDMFTDGRRAGADASRPTSPSASSSRSATSRRASPRPTWWSSATSTPSRCTRATSSRTPAWPACPRTARRELWCSTPGPLHRARPLRPAARHGHRPSCG